jgi:Cu/Ag efflux protein CusF
MRLAVLAIVALALVDCQRERTYSSSGDVMEVDAAGSTITLSHDDIPGLMGPMTMTFPVRAPEVVSGLVPGTRVRFELVRRGDALIVTRIEPAAAGAPAARPGVHDHTPHHGGVVTMVGMLHLEAVATPPGIVRVYLSDVWRKPLPVAGATGTVTVRVADARRELPLVAREDALEANGLELGGRELAAHMQVKRAINTEPIEAHFILPLTGNTPGAAEVPLDGCVPPPPAAEDGPRRPRCILHFGKMVTAVAVTPDGSTALVAVAGAGVSAWRLPAGEFLLGLAAAPAVTLPPNAAPHADEASAMAVSPDGREVVVAFEGRLPVFSVSDGRFLRELPSYRGVVRSFAWSPDGTDLLVSVLYDFAAHLIRAADGRESRRLEVEREAASVAISPDGRLAAVASEVGPITLFDLRSGKPTTVLSASQTRTRDLLFAAGGILASGADGLRLWDTDAGTLKAHVPGPVVARLAFRPGLIAAANMDRTVRLHDPETGAMVETLQWHRAPIWGVAWGAASTLISADADGNVALWDISAAR